MFTSTITADDNDLQLEELDQRHDWTPQKTPKKPAIISCCGVLWMTAVLLLMMPLVAKYSIAWHSMPMIPGPTDESMLATNSTTKNKVLQTRDFRPADN